MQFLILCVKCNFSGHNKEEETEEETETEEVEETKFKIWTKSVYSDLRVFCFSDHFPLLLELFLLNAKLVLHFHWSEIPLWPTV